MCGITGWVAFDRDLRAERRSLEAMTATMACRGPDDRGTWAAEHAALGHHRLVVIDPPGGRQPMSVQTPGGPVVLVYSGETYNFTELRALLEARGHRFGTASDTEVVLRGYLEWGTAVAERLNGMYAFAIWDARTQRLVMVRDRIGIKPIYYHPTADGVLFGSEPKAILAHPQCRRSVTIDGLRELFGYVKTPGRDIWDGVYEVEPGGIVTVDRRGVDRTRYWSLATAPHTDDREATVERVGELLDDIVARQLVADVPRCVLLSGGLDSSTLTALAARRLGDAGETVRSFAVDFTGQARHFVPGRPQLSLDTPFAHQVADLVGARHEDIVLDPERLADPGIRAEVIRARDFPSGGGDLDTSLYLLFAAIGEHSTVALSGEGADEVFGGYTQFFDPAVQQAATFPWLVHFAGQLEDERAMLTPELVAALDLETFWQDGYRTAVAGIDRLDGESDFEYRMRRISHLHITRTMRYLLDRKDRLSMAVGLEVRVPFCDHRLVEYVYNTPWSLKSYDGREKSLLRAAAAGLVPPTVRDRVKSGYPAVLHPAYMAAVQALGRELLGTPDHAVFGLISSAWLRTAVDTPAVQLPHSRRLRLHTVLDLAQWIDIFQPTLTIP